MNTTQSPKCKILIQLHLNYEKSFPSPYSPKTPPTNLLISKFSNLLILFPITTLPLSLGEGRGEDSLSFASKPRF